MGYQADREYLRHHAVGNLVLAQGIEILFVDGAARRQYEDGRGLHLRNSVSRFPSPLSVVRVRATENRALA